MDADPSVFDDGGRSIGLATAMRPRWRWPAEFAYAPVSDAASHVVVGYDAVIRCTDGALTGLGELAHTAGLSTSVGAKVELAASALRSVASELAVVAPHAFVSTALFPEAIHDESIRDELVRRPDQRLVVEVAVPDSFDRVRDLRDCMTIVTATGHQVAFRGAAAGIFSPLRVFTLAPAFVLLDRALVRDLADDGIRRRRVTEFVAVGEAVGSQVIATGVTDVDDLIVLRELGVCLVQGPIVGPASTTLSIDDARLGADIAALIAASESD